MKNLLTHRFVQQPREEIDSTHATQEKALEEEITSLGKKVCPGPHHSSTPFARPSPAAPSGLSPTAS